MKKKKSDYQKLLLDPRWQKKRLDILARDEFTCQLCYDSESTLHVHHLAYKWDKSPWDYEDKLLMTLCASCHETESEYAKKYKDLLIYELARKGFTFSDYQRLAGAFNAVDGLGYPAEVFATILAWAVQDEDFRSLMCSKFFERLESGRKQS